MDKKPLIILTGPTSVGKTALSVQLAKTVNGEIISADSMQVYKGMDIGTAKITPAQMEGIPHYLIDILDPAEDFNVVKFQHLAREAIRQIHGKGKIPILTGGTGFYIQAVLYNIDFEENKADSAYRNELEALAGQKGSQYLHDMLEKIDPESAKAIHPNNIKRVIRALEYAEFTGNLISTHNASQKNNESPYNFCYFVLNRDRAKLYETINHRVDIMLEEGLLEEVKALARRGYSRELVSMQGLGYKELLAYLEGKTTLEEAVDEIKKETRHFAKRQLTWFKREKQVIWINKDEFQNETEILEKITEICKHNNIT